MKHEIKFTPDEYVEVITHTAAQARKFFGLPSNYPVKFMGFSENPEKVGRVWGVKYDGKVAIG